MRPDTTSFSGEERLPLWMQALARQLKAGGHDAPADVLPPLAMLQELRVTANAVMAGRPIPRADRVSLQSDLRHALDHLGPAQRTAVTPHLTAFRRDELSRLAGFLSDVGGANRLSVAMETLSRRFAHDAVATAAWEDVVAAFRDGADTETCEIRVAQVRSIVERRGHDWEERERLLMGLLGDDLYDAVRVGAVPSPEDLSDMPADARAGLSEEQRLDACRQAIVEPPREAIVHVWFAFDRARLNDYLRKGPVQLFNSRLWPDQIRDKPLFDVDRFERPDELDDESTRFFLGGVPETDGVLARISLPLGPIAGARARAEHLLNGLIQSVSHESGWRLLKGSSAYSAQTGWWGSAGFEDPAQTDFRRASPEFDSTPAGIEKLDDRYVEALARGDQTAEDALSELRWDHAARSADPTQRLALRIRTIERALPTPSELQGKLASIVSRHFRESWVQYMFDRRIVDVASVLTSFRPTDPKARQALEALHGEVVTYERLFIHTSILAMVEHAEEAARLLPFQAMQGRMAAELAEDLQSGAATLARLSRFDEMFERLIARSIRQRNAVIHGSPVVTEVVESCDEFIGRLSGFVNGTGIAAAADGTSVVQKFEEARIARLEERHLLSLGGNFEGILVQREREAEAAPPSA